MSLFTRALYAVVVASALFSISLAASAQDRHPPSIDGKAATVRHRDIDRARRAHLVLGRTAGKIAAGRHLPGRTKVITIRHH